MKGKEIVMATERFEAEEVTFSSTWRSLYDRCQKANVALVDSLDSLGVILGGTQEWVVPSTKEANRDGSAINDLQAEMWYAEERARLVANSLREVRQWLGGGEQNERALKELRQNCSQDKQDEEDLVEACCGGPPIGVGCE